MKRKVYQVVFPAALVVVMVAFVSAIFFASATPSFAAPGKKKSSVTRISAVEHTETQIKQLQGALAITPAQEELWNNLTRVMRENAKGIDDISKERSESSKSSNAVEHMKLHYEISKAHLAQQEKLIPPFEALYASMSDEQKKSTDSIFRTGKSGKHKIK